jgi:hypothetical protein
MGGFSKVNTFFLVMSSLDLSRFESELRRKIKGEVHFDEVTRYLYSTDASLYQIHPVGVVVARDKEDVVQSIRTASEVDTSRVDFGTTILAIRLPATSSGSTLTLNGGMVWLAINAAKPVRF